MRIEGDGGPHILQAMLVEMFGSMDVEGIKLAREAPEGPDSVTITAGNGIYITIADDFAQRGALIVTFGEA